MRYSWLIYCDGLLVCMVVFTFELLYRISLNQQSILLNCLLDRRTSLLLSVRVFVATHYSDTDLYLARFDVFEAECNVIMSKECKLSLDLMKRWFSKKKGYFRLASSLALSKTDTTFALLCGRPSNRDPPRLGEA